MSTNFSDIDSCCSRLLLLASLRSCRSLSNSLRRFPAQPVAAIVLLLAFSPAAMAQLHPTDVQVKAAYLYNFGKFVRWQPDRPANASFDICVLGKDPFGNVLDSTVKGESIDAHQINVKRLQNMDEASHCNILFVAPSEQNRLSAILPAATRLNILTVSDMPGFAERGGVIELVNKEDRIRFEVNLTAAKESHLVLSSELLKIAVRVLQKNTQGS